jgi:hypothetical protein
VVRADDSRLGNPPVGGDLSGTAAAATVIKLRGRAVATTPPVDGQALVWNTITSQWEPGTISTGSGAVPAGGTTGQVLTKTGAADYATSWEDSASGGGGGRSAAIRLFLHRSFR